MALFFARTLTRPIRRLAAGAEEIGKGNLEYRVGTDARDEIGQLSRVFDGMIESLKRTTVSRDELLEEMKKRKLAEESLRVSATRQEALLTAIPDIIMEVDENKVYTWANQPGFDFFGDEVIGKPVDFYFEGEQATYRIVQSLFEGEENVIYVESRQRRQDGQMRLGEEVVVTIRPSWLGDVVSQEEMSRTVWSAAKLSGQVVQTAEVLEDHPF